MSIDPRKPPKIEPYPHIFFIEGAGLLEPHKPATRSKPPMTTPEGVTIEIHRKPPADWKGTGKNIGHLRAVGPDATVVVPCSLPLLDDPELVDHYVKTRLLHFYKLAAEQTSE